MNLFGFDSDRKTIQICVPIAFEIKASEGILVGNAPAVSVEGIPYFEPDTSDLGPGRSLEVRVELINKRVYEKTPPNLTVAAKDMSVGLGATSVVAVCRRQIAP